MFSCLNKIRGLDSDQKWLEVVSALRASDTTKSVQNCYSRVKCRAYEPYGMSVYS